MLVDYSRRRPAPASASNSARTESMMKRCISSGSMLDSSAQGARRTSGCFGFGKPDQKFGLDQLTTHTKKNQAAVQAGRRMLKCSSLHGSPTKSHSQRQAPSTRGSLALRRSRRRATMDHLPAAASNQKVALQSLHQLFGSRTHQQQQPETDDDQLLVSSTHNKGVRDMEFDLGAETEESTSSSYDDDDYSASSCTTFGEDGSEVMGNRARVVQQPDWESLGYGEATPRRESLGYGEAAPTKESLGYEDTDATTPRRSLNAGTYRDPTPHVNDDDEEELLDSFPMDLLVTNSWSRHSMNGTLDHGGQRRSSSMSSGLAKVRRQRRSTLQHNTAAAEAPPTTRRPSITFQIRRRSSRTQTTGDDNMDSSEQTLGLSQHTSTRRTSRASERRHGGNEGRRHSILGGGSRIRRLDTEESVPSKRRTSMGGGGGPMTVKTALSAQMESLKSSSSHHIPKSRSASMSHRSSFQARVHQQRQLMKASPQA